jgi:hypothetical protein
VGRRRFCQTRSPPRREQEGNTADESFGRPTDPSSAASAHCEREGIVTGDGPKSAAAPKLGGRLKRSSLLIPPKEPSWLAKDLGC